MERAQAYPQEELGNPEVEVSLALAQEHDGRVREIERQITGAWSELAELAIQVRDHEEWRLLNFGSFNQWLASAAPRSRAMVYSAIGLLEELKDDIPIEVLREVGIGNAHLLKVLPKGLRQHGAVLYAAKSLPPREFRNTVKTAAPDSHIESLSNQRFKFTDSQWDAIEEAIEEIMSQYDGAITTREEALEGICAEWMESQ
jgi:hypothetical protein